MTWPYSRQFKTWKTRSGITITQLLSGRSNVFLLVSGERTILIDTATKRQWARLDKRLQGLNIHRIDHLILTHTHFDHAGNARKIKDKYKARVIVHSSEAANLTTGEMIIPEGTNFLTRILVNVLLKKVAPKLGCEPCGYDLLADDIPDLHDIGFNARILHTPGHTTGSVSVLVDDEIAVVGDTMFGVFRWSVFPPFAQDAVTMIRSWGKLLESGCSVFLPSHGSGKMRSQLLLEFAKRINNNMR
jgi:hydroxyacylglutathione hydrolase